MPKGGQRLGGATAVGPLLMGISKPFNVLQRNTDMENVVNVIAITVAQIQRLQTASAPYCTFHGIPAEKPVGNVD